MEQVEQVEEVEEVEPSLSVLSGSLSHRRSEREKEKEKERSFIDDQKVIEGRDAQRPVR